MDLVYIYTRMGDRQTVKVTKQTWKSLNRRRDPGDTFDDVISDLVERAQADQDETATDDEAAQA